MEIHSNEEKEVDIYISAGRRREEVHERTERENKGKIKGRKPSLVYPEEEEEEEAEEDDAEDPLLAALGLNSGWRVQHLSLEAPGLEQWLHLSPL